MPGDVPPGRNREGVPAAATEDCLGEPGEHERRAPPPLGGVSPDRKVMRGSHSCKATQPASSFTRWRAITSRWISEVPSPISQILASRIIRSTG